MILYYLIAAALSVCACATIWAIISLRESILVQRKTIETFMKRLNTHGERILQLKTDLSSHQETIYLLKRSLSKCLQGAHNVPVKEHVNNPPKNKRGRSAKHS